MSSPLSLVYKTTAANQTVTITLTVTNGSPYAINWDASNSSTFTPSTGTGGAVANSNVYANIGIYRVDISGTSITKFRCNSSLLYSVKSFGTVGLVDLTQTFENCNGLTTALGEQQMPSSIPSTVTIMSSMFKSSNVNSSNMCSWDMSGVSVIDNMFDTATVFNQPIGASWDMGTITSASQVFKSATAFNNGGVTFGPKWKFTLGKLGPNGISSMFRGAANFIQPIGDWGYIGPKLDYFFSNCPAYNSTISFDTSTVTRMDNMFQNASNFNQDISGWNVSNVTLMNSMFSGASKFNQPLNNWNTSKVTNMNNMFGGTTVFNQSLSNWNVSAVTNMGNMFGGATAFNQDITGWNISNVLDFSSMFSSTSAFNQPIGVWTIKKATNLSNMFSSATAFNQPIATWDVSGVINMSGMFYGTTVFNQPIDSWNVSKVTNMNNMFRSTTAFNQPIGSWNVSNVLDFNNMFNNATAFNQPIGSWNVSKVTNMSAMFGGATSFNQPLGTWNVGNVTTMGSMFYGGSGMSVTNFDLTINGWAALPSLKSAVQFSTLNYSLDSSASYAILTTAPKSWVISVGYYAGSRPVITNVNNKTNGVNKTITFTQSTLSPVGTGVVYYYSYDGITRLGNGITNNLGTTYTFDLSSSVFATNKSLYIIAYYPISNPVGSLPSTTPYTINVTGSVVPVITDVVPGLNSSTITFSKNDAGWDTAPNYYYSFDRITKSGLATYPTFTLSSLTNSTPYTLYIIASNTPDSSNTESNLYSASRTLNVLGDAPVIGVITTSINQLSVEFSQATQGTSSTTYYYSTDGTTKLGSGTQTSPIVITGTASLTFYIIATNPAGDIRSATSAVGTPYVVGSTPIVLSVLPVYNSDTSISVSFTGSMGGVPALTKYQYSTDGTTFQDASGTTSPIIITGLSAGTSSIILRAVSGSTWTSSNSYVKVPCFGEGTRILCFNLEKFEEEYVEIQNIRKGTLVKTLRHDYVPVYMIGKTTMQNKYKRGDRKTNNLYKCTKRNYPEMMNHDLILTGCHCILVGGFKDVDEREKSIAINKGILYVTDGKYRLPACVDERAELYEKSGTFTIYHLALDNADYYMNYGIYANGLLVETSSKRYMRELSNMEML